MYVNSPQKATIESVLGSVRLIPAGYTAVPDLSGLIADGDNLEPLIEEPVSSGREPAPTTLCASWEQSK
ncbi:MAG: hypothetical protein M3445_06800 [Actinomycetota bacterium]|nr:hypothetical protein [Actinomycetota bacterium]